VTHLAAAPPRAAAHWLLVLVVIGYPAAGLAASAFDWDSQTASIPLRVAVLLLAGWVLVTSRSRLEPSRAFTLAAFALVYLGRLVWDAAVVSVPGAPEAILFFVVTVVIPCVALWKCARQIDHAAVARLMFYFGAAICLVAFLMHTFGIGQSRSLTEATGRLSFEALNPISIGHAAVTTLIAALSLTQPRLRWGDLPLMFAGVVVALAVSGLAAARGPVLGMAAAAMVYAVATRRWRWIMALALASSVLLMDPETTLWQRFVDVEDDASSVERLLLQGSAVSAFLSSPVWGSAFVEPVEFTYPHNLFIETGMALGVLGLLLLFALLAKSFRAAFRLAADRKLLLPMLFAQYFVGAQLSGAIWGNCAFWAVTTLLVAHLAATARVPTVALSGQASTIRQGGAV
jgi:hypothetical protein